MVISSPVISYEDRTRKHAQFIYAQETRERQYFMEGLQEHRRQKHRLFMRTVTDLVGPSWYQVLSVMQRESLDTLEQSIYQDLLEGRPVQTAKVMQRLSITPRPNHVDLMNCVFAGKDDPKAMLAELFQQMFGHGIEGKRSSYNLNARLILTSIFYLGLRNLIYLLRERFKPEPQPEVKKQKKKRKPEPPLQSPYLQKMVATLYLPTDHKKIRPAPLPQLDDLEEPYEEDLVIPKPPPPPAPPPPPKDTLPRSVCDKLAGIIPIEQFPGVTSVTMKTTTETNRTQRTGNVTEVKIKKTYGICVTRPKKGSRWKHLKAPSTGIPNAQYLIHGVCTVAGKTVFIIGTVSILPAEGDLIHGGFKYLDGGIINVHCGFRGFPPAPKSDPCDCVKRWQESVYKYLKETKCYCHHHYDFGHEGTFPPDELPFFTKPTPHTPFAFNYDTIYDMDEKSLVVRKEFKRVWDTDSVIGPKSVLQKDKKKKKKPSSETCLGQEPKPEDYLKCALRQMRRANLAAKLPDVHKAPELREWMRKRIYGPHTPEERREYLRRSTAFFQAFDSLANKGFGHLSTKRDPLYVGLSDWVQKLELNRRFKEFSERYRLDLFRSLAHVNNLFWTTMYHSKFPDKKFREIFFSYLCSTVEDMHLLHPYDRAETNERTRRRARGRAACPPAGAAPA